MRNFCGISREVDCPRRQPGPDAGTARDQGSRTRIKPRSRFSFAQRLLGVRVIFSMGEVKLPTTWRSPVNWLCSGLISQDSSEGRGRLKTAMLSRDRLPLVERSSRSSGASLGGLFIFRGEDFDDLDEMEGQVFLGVAGQRFFPVGINQGHFILTGIKANVRA